MNFRKIGYRDEPFIMVQQASQVFYVKNPTSEHWYVTSPPPPPFRHVKWKMAQIKKSVHQVLRNPKLSSKKF